MTDQEAQSSLSADKTGSIEQLLTSRERDLGGFAVRRLLPAAQRRLVGPFIFFDELMPTAFPAGQGLDVRPHPHIGLATITYLFEGEILHRDGLGHVQAIRPGAVNLMIAGHGIVHSERTGPDERKKETRLHGIQSWVALPRTHEETKPAFHHHPAESLPLIERPGARLRLIVGEAFGKSSPVETFSTTLYVEVDLSKGARLQVPADHRERAAYVVSGAISLAGKSIEAGSMAVFVQGAEIVLVARETAKLMLIGGEPLYRERHIWWNFVSSSPERIEQAKEDWKSGRFVKIPGDDEDFVPLPSD